MRYHFDDFIDLEMVQLLSFHNFEFHSYSIISQVFPVSPNDSRDIPRHSPIVFPQLVGAPPSKKGSGLSGSGPQPGRQVAERTRAATALLRGASHRRGGRRADVETTWNDASEAGLACRKTGDLD